MTSDLAWTQTPRRGERARRSAAVVAVLTGLGFGVPDLGGTVHMARTGKVWTFLGFPTYGGGPFDRLGLDTTVPLLVAFGAVCAAEVGLGVLLWRRAPWARTAHRLLLPAEFTLWLGFALPFGPVLGTARIVLLMLERHQPRLLSPWLDPLTR